MGVPPEKWGPYFWGVIHLGCLAGSITPEFISMYPSVLPCGACGQHFAEVLMEVPFPDSQDPLILFQWSVRAHNMVNARIGKPILTVEEALATWTAPVPQFDFKIAAAVLALFLLVIFMIVKNK
jgi:hypothetical protein